MSYLITLHLFGAALWIGGMFFSLFILRPVCIRALEGPSRLLLMMGVMSRFFAVVWLLVGLILATGFGMVASLDMANMSWTVQVMLVVGSTMALVFLYAFFVPFNRAKAAFAANDGPATGKQLEAVRKLVVTNFSLSLFLILAGGLGRYI
jgi:uncharacterized membrane protein